ncbi:hypothetical protein XBFM1_1840001 [Xenorhabdus bovienii str. feltiae Moldova]|uniref:Uncharacterized protein n=1 Tax=Xenorhabdus bovienii str. feltiae Moldova TaxID=1398200 RepID=A0A077NF61_XENBV|nr:hypothetical protein XBFM1_1840001 [Xenorhabdus bovienii str. feltiae Moldova]
MANRLNNRPRKTRDYKTPNELFKGIPHSFASFITVLRLICESKYFYYI